jgi:multicomponent Na+:H+ antiporter subunit G
MDFFVILLMLLGALFFTGGSIGIIRFPDFFTRLHPAGKLDTMGLLFTMTSCSLYNLNTFNLNNFLVSLKIIFIVVFIFITSPTATHAIADAGLRAGLIPWTKKR